MSPPFARSLAFLAHSLVRYIKHEIANDTMRRVLKVSKLQIANCKLFNLHVCVSVTEALEIQKLHR